MKKDLPRIISGVLIILLIILVIYLGKTAALLLILLLGTLVHDELLVNFFQDVRWKLNYLIKQVIVIFLLLLFFFKDLTSYQFVIYWLSFVVNIYLVYYLFYENIQNKFLIELVRKYNFLSTLYVIIVFVSLGQIILLGNWNLNLGLFIICCASMDTGAWFFGKNFGKTKLWERISPNKTIEGLIGGAVTSSILSSLAYYYFYNNINFTHVISFVFIALLSHVGDLIQSKLKRQVGIKDSSHIIPGHGGVYDRLDSIVFTAPFYLFTIKYLI